MEEAETGQELLKLHGLGARRQRRGQPKRRADRHEQHGALASSAARLLLVCMTGARRHGTRRSRAYVTLHCPFPII